MYNHVYLAFHVITLVAVFLMAIMAARFKPSRSQMGCVLYFSILFVLLGGYAFELTAKSLDVYRIAVKIEIFSLCSLAIILMRLVSDYCNRRIPTWIYIAQSIISAVTIILAFSMEYHELYLKNLAAYLALVKSHRLTPFVAGRGVLRQRADALPEPPHFPEAPEAHAEQETLKTGLRETLRRGRIRPGTSLKIIIWAAAAAASR